MCDKKKTIVLVVLTVLSPSMIQLKMPKLIWSKRIDNLEIYLISIASSMFDLIPRFLHRGWYSK